MYETQYAFCQEYNLNCFSKQLISLGKTIYFPGRNNLIWEAAKVPCDIAIRSFSL